MDNSKLNKYAFVQQVYQAFTAYGTPPCKKALQFDDFAFETHFAYLFQCTRKGITHIFERFFTVVEYDNRPCRKIVGDIAQTTFWRKSPVVIARNDVPHNDFVPFGNGTHLRRSNTGIRRTEQFGMYYVARKIDIFQIAFQRHTPTLLVGICMVADLMPRIDDFLVEVGVQLDILAEYEEGGFGIVFFQSRENPLGDTRCRTVVEGQKYSVIIPNLPNQIGHQAANELRRFESHRCFVLNGAKVGKFWQLSKICVILYGIGIIRTQTMKQMTKIFTRTALCIAIAVLTVGCGSFGTLSNGGKKTAQGSPYEVLVVCQAPEWEGDAGKALRELLEQPVEMINQTEPLFNVMRVTYKDFKNVLPLHRNILKVVISPKVSQPTIAVQYDVEAAPQIVLTLQGATEREVVDYLAANGDKLLYVLEMAERDRTIRFAEKHNAKALGEIIQKEFGISMTVPQGYELRSQSDGFVWASYEFPTASQGFFVYSYPYRGKGSLGVEELVRMRNKFAARIPGPSAGSYMTTVDKLPDAEAKEYLPFMPDHKTIKIGDRTWIEMRGLWEVENDFMGGPFVSYTTIDERSGRVLTLDCYVYSPKYGKRNFLRAVEHLVYLTDIPQAN